MFDAIQLKRAAAQLKRAVEILAVDPKDYRALSYVAARAMMVGKDEKKWEVIHAQASAKEARGHLDRAEHLLRQGILQSLRFLAPGCWLARARVYRTHQITPDERRAPRSRPLTREQSAALRVRAHRQDKTRHWLVGY